MRYLAYGSNLFEPRLRSRVPHASFRTVARLHGFALKFHKRSVDGSAKCNIVPASDEVVIGVIFEVPHAEKRELDRAEGLGNGYEEQELMVVFEDGEERSVVTYVASSAHVDARLQPYTWYREYVIRGARSHGFPSAYVEAIAEVVAIRDPDPDREARELAVLESDG